MAISYKGPLSHNLPSLCLSNLGEELSQTQCYIGPQIFSILGPQMLSTPGRPLKCSVPLTLKCSVLLALGLENRVLDLASHSLSDRRWSFIIAQPMCHLLSQMFRQQINSQTRINSHSTDVTMLG